MAKNETADYKLTVKELEPDGEVPRTFLSCEPMTREFSFLDGKGSLALHLKPGIDVRQATEIARFIQQSVQCFAVTFR